MRRIACIALGGLVAMSAAEAAPLPSAQSHVRVRTPRGPVHVWTPGHYDADTADVVVYVHGYYVTVDEAWQQHALAAQFERSRLNAMFVVCGAPTSHVDPIDWESLDDLLRALGTTPRGRVIAVAHSGGYRTIKTWAASERLSGMILLDAAYGPFPELQRWLAASREHRLVDVSELTRAWATDLHSQLPESLVVDELTDEPRDARIVHLRTAFGHMELVTGGVVLPTLLRWFER